MLLIAFIITSWTLAHLYLYVRLLSLFPFLESHPVFLALLLMFLYLAIVIGRILENIGAHFIGYPFTFIGAVWLGFGFYLIIFMLFVDFLGIFPWFSGFLPELRYIALMGSALISVFAVYQAVRMPVIRDYIVEINNLPEKWSEKRIIVLSDLHAGMVMGKSWLKSVIKRVNELEPDIVFVVGDVYDGGEDLRKSIEPVLRDLKAKEGVYAVFGNHEHYNGVRESEELFKKVGWKVLINSCDEVDGVFICGVDDLTIKRRKRINEDYVANTLSDVRGQPVILLSHSPLEVEHVKDYGVSLMLSGHTHDGQIWPFGYLVKLEYPYMAGLYKTGKITLIVSRGTGTWGPPMRLFKPGEIGRISLVRKS